MARVYKDLAPFLKDVYMSRNEYDSIYDRVFDIYKDVMEYLSIIDTTDDMTKIRQAAVYLHDNISAFLYDLEAATPEED